MRRGGQLHARSSRAGIAKKGSSMKAVDAAVNRDKQEQSAGMTDNNLSSLGNSQRQDVSNGSEFPVVSSYASNSFRNGASQMPSVVQENAYASTADLTGCMPPQMFVSNSDSRQDAATEVEEPMILVSSKKSLVFRGNSTSGNQSTVHAQSHAAQRKPSSTKKRMIAAKILARPGCLQRHNRKQEGTRSAGAHKVTNENQNPNQPPACLETESAQNWI